MNAFIDFEDKTVDKAVEKACAKLSVTKERLQYDIISHGSSGIFGIVRTKKALIRVTVPDVASEQPAKPVKPGKIKVTPKTEAAPEQPVKTKPAPKTEAEQVTALVDEAFGTVEAEEPPPRPAPAQPLDAEQSKAMVDWVTGFIEQTIGLISPGAALNIEFEGEVSRFRIQGGDSARLIGKRGQTLEAIQYLIEKAVLKQFGTAPVVEIDVEGYLDKRRSDLVAMATHLAEKAQQTGKPMVINRINAQDRRIIHLSLKDNRSVRTQSVGNGDFRKLLILPKKKVAGKKGQTPDSSETGPVTEE